MIEKEICLQEIANRISDRRRKLNLTQEALAELADVTPQFISNAESAKRGMRPENLLKVSSALGVSADYLLTGDIIDKDQLLISDKLSKLTPVQFKAIESIIDECINLNETK